MLNFIIAEACASYARVTNSLTAVIWKEKASLIDETEDMMPNFLKSDE